MSQSDRGQERSSHPTVMRPRLISLSLRLLLHLRAQFQGDLDSGIVHLVLLEQAARHPNFNSMLTAGDGEDAADAWASLYGVNTKSIADSTGIARETVRRKLRELERRGWAMRHPDGLYRVTRSAMMESREEAAELTKILAALASQGSSEGMTD